MAVPSAALPLRDQSEQLVGRKAAGVIRERRRPSRAARLEDKAAHASSGRESGAVALAAQLTQRGAPTNEAMLSAVPCATYSGTPSGHSIGF